MERARLSLKTLKAAFSNSKEKLQTSQELYDLHRFLDRFPHTKGLSKDCLDLCIRAAKIDWGPNIRFVVDDVLIHFFDLEKQRDQPIVLSEEGLVMCSTIIPQKHMATLFKEFSKKLEKYKKNIEYLESPKETIEVSQVSWDNLDAFIKQELNKNP